ncbi:MAG: GNAT family N-acetyltransferase [Acidimicrobiales bacterium]|nr:GNAT family N-acetyltransferase [Acidimicrobiales bacterium]
MPEVRPATDDDLPALGASLAAAFADDPVWTWMAGPHADWTARATTWFAREADAKRRGHAEVLVDDECRGAAIWAPPNRWRSTWREALAIAGPSLRLFGRRLPQGLRLVSMVDKAHPREPHWYLALLGTDPSHQGTGVGGALITRITDRCDRDGLPAYLESSKESNVSYYARHGFEVREVLQVPGGPTLWGMWREPRDPDPDGDATC